MQKRLNVLPAALFFLLVSFLILSTNQIVAKIGIAFNSDGIVVLVQRGVFGVLSSVFFSPQKRDDTPLESANQQAVSFSEKKEIQALRDQFETTNIPSSTLLPTKIVGLQGFIPGVSWPTEIIIDKGSAEKVQVGFAVIYKNNLVGRVQKVSNRRALVTLLTKSGWSFTAKTSKTNANGLATIEGGDLYLRNVVVADTLENKDLVVTKGDQALDGGGFPPDIVVGQIISIEKKASNLFQTAKVKSLLDVTRLTTVFVFLPE